MITVFRDDWIWLMSDFSVLRTLPIFFYYERMKNSLVQVEKFMYFFGKYLFV